MHAFGTSVYTLDACAYAVNASIPTHTPSSPRPRHPRTFQHPRVRFQYPRARPRYSRAHAYALGTHAYSLDTHAYVLDNPCSHARARCLVHTLGVHAGQRRHASRCRRCGTVGGADAAERGWGTEAGAQTRLARAHQTLCSVHTLDTHTCIAL